MFIDYIGINDPTPMQNSIVFESYMWHSEPWNVKFFHSQFIKNYEWPNKKKFYLVPYDTNCPAIGIHHLRVVWLVKCQSLDGNPISDYNDALHLMAPFATAFSRGRQLICKAEEHCDVD